MRLALSNLTADPTRFVLSVTGVAVSVALILLLAGYRAGIYRQATAYLDNTAGSVVVAERGIRDFLGTSSVLPMDTERTIRASAGVTQVIPVAAQFVVFERHGRKDGFFLVGYEPGSGGGPWNLVEGREPHTVDELVVDRTMAGQHDIVVGDTVRVLDRDAVVVGLSDETTFWAGSLAFARISMLETLARTPGLRSFLLVSPAGGEATSELIERLDVAGVEILAKADVVDNDRRLMARVYDVPIGFMVAIAFLVGVLIVGLTVSTSTMERRREYGALKAIGARNRTLYRVVLTQALAASAAGGIGGVGVAVVGGAALMAWRPQFLVSIEATAVGVVLASCLLMAILAALIPARALSRLEPAEVFRG